MNVASTAPQLGELTAKAWHKVASIVNKLLDTHRKYGYSQFQAELNPSLPELLEGFKHIDSALTALMETGVLTYDEFRDAVNSKQCILKMRLLSVALDKDEQEDYERIISDLDKQLK